MAARDIRGQNLHGYLSYLEYPTWGSYHYTEGSLLRADRWDELYYDIVSRMKINKDVEDRRETGICHVEFKIGLKELIEITKQMREKLRKSNPPLDSKFKLRSIVIQIMKLLLGIPINSKLTYVLHDKPIWQEAFSIAQVYHARRNCLCLENAVQLYRIFHEIPDGKIFTVDMNHSINSIGCRGKFYETVVKGKMQEHIRELVMWNLWDDYDTEKHEEGYGNLLTWLPQESLVDVLSLKPFHVQPKIKPETRWFEDPIDARIHQMLPKVTANSYFGKM